MYIRIALRYKGFGSSRRLRCCAYHLNTEPDDPCPCLMFARPVSVFVFVGKVRPCVHFVSCHFSSFFFRCGVCSRIDLVNHERRLFVRVIVYAKKPILLFKRGNYAVKPKPLSALGYKGRFTAIVTALCKERTTPTKYTNVLLFTN